MHTCAHMRAPTHTHTNECAACFPNGMTTQRTNGHSGGRYTLWLHHHHHATSCSHTRAQPTNNTKKVSRAWKHLMRIRGHPNPIVYPADRSAEVNIYSNACTVPWIIDVGWGAYLLPWADRPTPTPHTHTRTHTYT